jgi:hypothetical protein
MYMQKIILVTHLVLLDGNVLIVMEFDHWAVLTNKHPRYPGRWIIYDSLNNSKYVNDGRMRLAMRVIAPESSIFLVDTVIVIPQIHMGDCGLFALSYAQALANDIDPATLQLDQSKLRAHYNNNIRLPIFRDFPSIIVQLENYEFATHEVSLADIQTQTQYFQTQMQI